MGKPSKIRFYTKKFGPFACVLVLFILLVTIEPFQTTVFTRLGQISEYEYLDHLIMGTAVILSIFHGMSMKSKGTERNKEVVLFGIMGPLFDSVLSGLTYGGILTACHTIASGISKQLFLDEKYFCQDNLTEIKLTIILFAMFFVSFWSGRRIVLMAVQLYKMYTLEYAKITKSDDATESDDDSEEGSGKLP